MNGALLNISMQLLALVLVLFIAKKHKLSFKNDIGFKMPKPNHLLFWFAAFVLLIYLEDYISKSTGNSSVESWNGKYNSLQIIWRILAIVVLAPISEELLFRGLIYFKVKKTRLKIVGAIFIPALLFAIIHFQYSELLTIGFIFIDGIFYGLARHYSKSVLLAILLHAFSNLGAILERLL